MRPMQRIRLGLLCANIKIGLTRDASNCNYKNLNRDRFGRWLPKGKSGETKKQKKKKGKTQNLASSITKQEYAGFMHKLMEDMTKEQRKKRYIAKYYGDALYLVEKIDDGEYNILYKKRIKI